MMNKRTIAYSFLPLLAALITGIAIAHSGGGGGSGYGGGMGQGMADRGMMSPGMMGPGMMGMMPVDEITDEQLDQIGEQLQRMHEQMENITNAKKPEERREAVKQHLQSMNALMHQRRDMMIEQYSRRQNQGNWQRHMEERMHRMEEMIQSQ